MKKMQKSIQKFVLLTFGMLASLYGYAQENAVDTGYHYNSPRYEAHTNVHNFPVTAVIFGALFVLGIYALYHFISNGSLTDDMSERPHHQ